ncbi:unnamed protein product [Blepharisma stoltei]|uniref:Cysteine protease n=1 Tax=Blepharisma stoltei TaxID=1481888 RepID=A0AAU9JK08_9CILI|nr:unnamed protein product [Blepharisma stoltei]
MDGFYLISKSESPKKNTVLAGFAILGLAALVGLFMIVNTPNHESTILSQYKTEEQEFTDYMIKFNKNYNTDEEYLKRFKIFRENSAFIRVHNSLDKDWTLGINQFVDMTLDEFREIYLSNEITVPEEEETEDFHREHYENVEAPTSIDWRSKGAVQGVKYQGQCGGCWSFSTVSAVESSWFIAGHGLPDLSEQQLLDCGGPFGNYGCAGGNIVYGFSYVQKYGLTSESIYPYQAATKTCNTSKQSQKIASIKYVVKVTANDPNALMAAVAVAPVSIGAQADQAAWMYYKGGIVTGSCGIVLNHAVNIVGYNNGNNPPYWIVRNSWGSWWGENGYIRIAISGGNGICGVNMMPMYPVS